MVVTVAGCTGQATILQEEGDASAASNDGAPTAAAIEPATAALAPVSSTSESTEPTTDPVTVLPTPEPPTSLPIPRPLLPPGVVAGHVLDDNGPVSGAIVRIQNTDIQTVSAADGSFTLSNIAITEPISVTAWIDGYYNGAATAIVGLVPITIPVRAYHTDDNPLYRFQPAEDCGTCHLELAEWQADAHSQSAVNVRFLTLYKGTDIAGNQSELPRDAAGLPLPPEPGQPYFGPGFKADFPDRTGNCAACHTPMASRIESDNTCAWSGCHTEFTASISDQVPPGVSPTSLTHVAAEGITCDFCHKIGDVILNEETGLPLSAKPGISSMKLLRPPDEEHDLFLGTFDDVPSPDSYLPLQAESAFCAPCHYGVFGGIAGGHEVSGGVSIYNSFGEWLDSPYSDPETGQTCQDCHMPPVDYDYFVYPDKGGLPRGGDRIHNHLMPGANDKTLLQNSVTITSTARREADELWVEISLANDQTGHYVPTGTPLRQMILVVRATDLNGTPLRLSSGPTLPGWTGSLAEQPGKYFAKILQDEWTGEVPTAAFWRDIKLVEDTRLATLATDTSQYTFDAPETGPVTIEARLIFRRAFAELMTQKGWDDPDIVMEEAVITVGDE
jgi:hypothetical protein